MKVRKAFTLIELLVVIAIIAILAAILFPVFSKAKESAKLTQASSQMRQMSLSIFMYATDHDDYFVPATIYPADSSPRQIWSPLVFPYVKNKDLYAAPGTTGKYADGWDTRNQQNVGLNGATAVDFTAAGCQEGQADTTGCEGFRNAANFAQAEFDSRVGLITTTPAGPLAGKYRGYVFSPYNGQTYTADPKLSVPLVSDRDLVAELGGTLTPARLKPMHLFYGKTGNDDGRGPIVFADGHVKTYSAKEVLARKGEIIWRFR